MTDNDKDVDEATGTADDQSAFAKFDEMMVDDEMTARSVTISEVIEKILAGEDPAIQGAIVMQMLATFIAGHHPSIRTKTMQDLIAAATDLVPVQVESMIEIGRAPPEWRDPDWTAPQGTA